MQGAGPGWEVSDGFWRERGARGKKEE